MRIIGLSFGFFVLSAAAVFRAHAFAADETPLSGLASLAAALSANELDSALAYFDRGMKGYDVIERNLEALTAQTDISCFIDILTDEASDGGHKLDVDWFLQLKSRTDDSRLERRRERVQLQMR